MKLISSKDNPFYKRLKQLAQSNPQRRKLGQTLLEGVHLADAYLDALGQPLVCVAAESALENPEVAQIWARVDGDRRVCRRGTCRQRKRRIASFSTPCRTRAMSVRSCVARRRPVFATCIACRARRSLGLARCYVPVWGHISR